MLVIIQSLFPDGFKVQALFRQFHNLLIQECLLGAGRQGIEDICLLTGIFFFKHAGSLTGSIVAAGQALGHGGTENHICIAESIQPFTHTGTGRTGGSLVVFQVFHHLGYIQLCIINIFLLCPDLHGNAEIMRILQGQDIGGGISYNSIIHKSYPVLYF